MNANWKCKKCGNASSQLGPNPPRFWSEKTKKKEYGCIKCNHLDEFYLELKNNFTPTDFERWVCEKLRARGQSLEEEVADIYNLGGDLGTLPLHLV